MANLPIIRKTPVYIEGLTSVVTGAKKILLSSGICSNSLNTNDIVVLNDIEIDATVTGLNGLDTGTFGSSGGSTFYYVHVIADSSGYRQTAALLSLSIDNPVMPYGYDIYRMVDIKHATGTSPNASFDISYTLGNLERTFIWETPKNCCVGFNEESFTVQSLTGIVPANLAISLVEFIGSFTPDVAGDVATIRPTGSSSTGTAYISGTVASVASTQVMKCFVLNTSQSNSIEAKVSSSDDALTLDALSFTFDV